MDINKKLVAYVSILSAIFHFGMVLIVNPVYPLIGAVGLGLIGGFYTFALIVLVHIAREFNP